MNKLFKIAIAITIGAGFGAIFSKLAGGLWWLLFCPLGGFVGYISYEFKKVLKAIHEAWDSIIQWRPNWEYWKAVVINFGFFMNVGILALLLFGYPLCICVDGSMVAGVWFVVGATLLISICYTREEFKGVKGAIDLSFKKKYNVFAFYGYYIWKWILIGLYRSIEIVLLLLLGAVFYTPDASKAVWASVKAKAITFGHFIREVFIKIHSEGRLLVGIWSLIGGLIGVFSGKGFAYALLGIACGVALGLLDNEFIGKRLLKVKLNHNHS